jgi:polysaccharide export outer membrane protein
MNESPFDIFTEYRIAPGDILDVLFQVRTWLKKDDFKIALDHTVSVKFTHSPELDSSQRVRPDGNITLSYLGEVYVVGKTVSELTSELKKRYSTILQIPEILVLVPEFRSSINELKTDLHTSPRGLSRLVTVRPDGRVTFPLVGDFYVAGKTIPEVNELLNDNYESYLPGLHCDLFLEKHSGSMIYIAGQVRKPGSYSISRPVTVLEALSLAESYLPGARLDSILIFRKHDNELVATRFNLTEALSLAKAGKLFYLRPDDIVYVPKTWVKDAAEVMSDIANVILFRGWSVGISNNVNLNNSTP